MAVRRGHGAEGRGADGQACAERKPISKRLEASGETQLSRTDADARLLTKNGQTVAGYNVQIAVDDKHKLIVASEVVNDGNDTGQLSRDGQGGEAGARRRDAAGVADVGYYNGAKLKACEDDGIVAYVPQAKRSGRLAAQGRFSHEDFSLRRRDGRLSLSGRRAAAADEKPQEEHRRQDRDPLCEPQSHLRRLSSARALCHRQSARRAPSIAGSTKRSSSGIGTDAGGRRADAPPLRPRRTSLRHAQMPRRLSPLPGARLRQGARRVEPDGALLFFERLCLAMTPLKSLTLSVCSPDEAQRNPGSTPRSGLPDFALLHPGYIVQVAQAFCSAGRAFNRSM